MTEQNDVFADPRLFGSTGLDRLGASPLRAMDPRQVGPYRVLALLGGGGMGRIYLGRPVDGASGLAAVKVIRPEYAEDEGFRRRFERESSALGRVRGEQAAVLLGSGYDGDLLWMATEYIPGPSLSEAVATSGPVGATAAWRLALELAQAVSAMERVGVVHRDIKPSNVILGPAGCRVIDFGISQAADTSSITTTGQQVGTPAYMSPEQVRGQVVASSSDLFALGSVIAFALTGHGPFGDGTTVDVLHRVAFEEPKEAVLGEIEVVDPTLAELVRACLDKNADARPTAQDVIDRAAPRQVAAPWSAELSAAIMSRVEVATAVQGLPLPTTEAPVADDGTILLGRGAGGAAVAGASASGAPVAGAPTPAVPPTPPTAFAQGRPTPPTVPAMPEPTAVPSPSPVLPGYLSVAPGLTPAQPEERRRSSRGVLLAVAAVIAVAALTGTTIALTGGSKPADPHTVAQQQGTGGSVDGAPASASASASASGSGAPSNAGTSAVPSASASRSTAAQPGTTPAGGSSAQPGGQPGGVPATTPGTPAPQQSTPAATHSSAPPPPPPPPAWIQNCTYYSGSEETDKYAPHNSNTAANKEVQCLLWYRGSKYQAILAPVGGMDGQFGDGTAKAVEAFQSCMGLSADGGVGPNTWPALRSTSNC
ncbi:peptidoglycan hydrolase-like protein with peptidoglycan-binding domain [Streptacidiphilus sp. MAP12-20]|uniref:protein kinase domain-containing protein n=1 Tax=Streptacidiphilus sp. MAP12-20 TaxID=3156299 RepID=UPI0035185506